MSDRLEAHVSGALFFGERSGCVDMACTAAVAELCTAAMEMVAQ